MHEYKIADARAARDWADLLGMRCIHGDTVRTTHEFYEQHAGEIHAIQMLSYFRAPRSSREGM